MSDELDKKQEELKKIEQELKHNGLSRRNFLNRLSAVGVGFGAAVTLGVKGADAASDAAVNVTSTNPALDSILAEGQVTAVADEGDPLQHMAQYGRFFRRGFGRGYPRFFRRGYPRFYGRGFGRGYPRFFRRFFRRF